MDMIHLKLASEGILTRIHLTENEMLIELNYEFVITVPLC
jgi:hypothetical protein